MSEDLIGQVLAGKYRVERVLGQGAMGFVVAATHIQLRQPVAIKFLHDRATPSIETRFLREARAAARLTSEHVARVLDVGVLDNGAPYMVMEYLDGSDLAAVLQRSVRLSIGEAVGHVLQASEAIAEAHAAGIIHRDLKPANLFLARTADGSSIVKVLDFGISKTAEDRPEADGLQLTQTSDLLGSPLYMSPEQLQSARRVTAQSDIWSLGAILYQLLAGRVPFDANSFPELVLMVNMQEPPRLSALRPDVPAGLEAAILRCLAKKLDVRFANVGELASAIAPYAPPEARASEERIYRTFATAGIRVERASDPRGPMPSRPSDKPALSPALTAAESLADTVAQTPRRRSPVLILGALVLAALIATFVVLAIRMKAPPDKQSAVSTAVVLPSAAAPVIVAPSRAAPPAPELPAAPSSAVAPPEASAAPTRSTAGGPPRGAASVVRPAGTAQATATPSAPTPPKNPLQVKLKE